MACAGSLIFFVFSFLIRYPSSRVLALADTNAYQVSLLDMKIPFSRWAPSSALLSALAWGACPIVLPKVGECSDAQINSVRPTVGQIARVLVMVMPLNCSRLRKQNDFQHPQVGIQPAEKRSSRSAFERSLVRGTTKRWRCWMNNLGTNAMRSGC